MGSVRQSKSTGCSRLTYPNGKGSVGVKMRWKRSPVVWRDMLGYGRCTVVMMVEAVLRWW